MQKMRNIFNLRNMTNIKVIAISALLSAVSIVAGKFLAIPGGAFMRFSFENFPIILSGILFGPFCGLFTGTVADLVGCVIVGYPINPIITLGAAVIGFIAGFVYRIISNSKHIIATALSVFIPHIIGSVLIKSAGLIIFAPYIVLLGWRALNYFLVGIAEFYLLYLLLKNTGFKKQISRITGEKL